MIEDVLKYRNKYFEPHEPAWALLTLHAAIVKQSRENKLDPYPFKSVRVLNMPK